MSRVPFFVRALPCLPAIAAAVLLAHPVAGADRSPVIEVDVVPPPGGGPDRMEVISGRVTNADPSLHRIVIFSRTDRWYVQPYISAPFTTIGRPDGTWSTRIHLGAEYAVLLVTPAYDPPATTFDLPREGGDIVAILRVPARQ